jgi:predicted nucleic-acid-binding protein
MIGLDTNVLIRHLVEDDPLQTQQVAKLLADRCSEAEPGFVNRIVLCEAVWTLDRTYGYGRADIVRVLEALIFTRELLIEDREHVAAALKTYRTHKIDFSDALIVEINRARGCKATATFDRRASRVSGFVGVN